MFRRGGNCESRRSSIRRSGQLPGAHPPIALAAWLTKRAGRICHDAAYLSGAALSAGAVARQACPWPALPDVGLFTLSELAINTALRHRRAALRSRSSSMPTPALAKR